MGISVIPCMGKTNLDRPTTIFKELCIPVFTIWDNDFEGKEPKTEVNHRLLRLFSQKKEDFPNIISDNFACFQKDLTETLRNEIGSGLYDTLLEEICDNLCISKHKNARKNPIIVKTILDKAKEQGKSSHTLENIIEAIIKLKNSK
jgi:hypothetical protein